MMPTIHLGDPACGIFPHFCSILPQKNCYVPRNRSGGLLMQAINGLPDILCSAL